MSFNYYFCTIEINNIRCMNNNMFFGLHPVEELIKAEKEIEKIFVQTGLRSPQI